MTTSGMVDWTVALTTARRLVNPGPSVSRAGAVEVVAGLRRSAVEAEAYVASVTGLVVPSAAAPVLVVDRPGWIQANVDAFAEVLRPLQAKAAVRAASPVVTAVGSRITGVELGALLSYLAPKILGQFDPFYPGGRLLLVAPNVVAVERELDLHPLDFRLWVCLHEETHRVQFAAVPWLGGYLNGMIEQVVDETDLDSGAVARLLNDAARRLLDALRNGEQVSLPELVQTPRQRELVDQITAVMSLLEGHADVVMDSVGPEVIPSVATIRKKFDVRRQGQGLDKVVRRLLGLEAKMRQYRDGAAFCRSVIDQVKMAGLNRVWTSPETLPTKNEIADPSRWLHRVWGDATIGPGPGSDA